MGDKYVDLNSSDEVIMEQMKDSEESVYWESLDINQVKAKFREATEHIDKAIRKINDLIEGGTDFAAAQEAVTALRVNDLSASGWIAQFITNNKEAFGYKGTEKPSGYQFWEPKKKADYEYIKGIYLDAVMLKDLFALSTEFLKDVPVADLFRLVSAYWNLEDGGFTETVYDKMKTDFKSLDELLHSINPAVFDSSDRYYKEHRYEIEAGNETFVKKYKEEKKRDLIYGVQITPFYQANLISKHDGTFTLKNGIADLMGILDDYTTAIAKVKDIDSKLEKVIPQQLKILQEHRAINDHIGQAECRELGHYVARLVTGLGTYAEKGLEYYKGFKAGSGSPYCFMKLVPTLKKMDCGFEPYLGDPWREGTDYYNAYVDACEAINRMSKEMLA